MYSINGIEFKDYGLHVSNHKGQANLLNPKKQFFTIYGKEGYEITKRKGKLLSIIGYIIADDLADFQAKTSALSAVFQLPGTKEILLDNNGLTCLSDSGYRIDRVRIYPSGAYGRFLVNLTITSEGNVTVFNPPLLVLVVGIIEPVVAGDSNFVSSLISLNIAIVEPAVSGDANVNPTIININAAIIEPAVSGDSEFVSSALSVNFAIIEPIVTTV